MAGRREPETMETELKRGLDTHVMTVLNWHGQEEPASPGHIPETTDRNFNGQRDLFAAILKDAINKLPATDKVTQPHLERIHGLTLSGDWSNKHQVGAVYTECHRILNPPRK